jgi:hypothetical protein
MYVLRPNYIFAYERTFMLGLATEHLIQGLLISGS